MCMKLLPSIRCHLLLFYETGGVMPALAGDLPATEALSPRARFPRRAPPSFRSTDSRTAWSAFPRTNATARQLAATGVDENVCGQANVCGTLNLMRAGELVVRVAGILYLISVMASWRPTGASSCCCFFNY